MTCLKWKELGEVWSDVSMSWTRGRQKMSIFLHYKNHNKLADIYTNCEHNHFAGAILVFDLWKSKTMYII